MVKLNEILDLVPMNEKVRMIIDGVSYGVVSNKDFEAFLENEVVYIRVGKTKSTLDIHIISNGKM